MEFRDYQLKIRDQGVKQCLNRGWCYLSMEVRTGKTLTALGIAAGLGGAKKRVVFATKKKAITSIQHDIQLLNDKSIDVDVINYESLHKLDLSVHVDVWILDESHCLGAFPKASKKVKDLRQIISPYSSVVFLSGTPTPESNSQIFHQLHVLGDRSPFKDYNFYQWSKKFCNIKEKRFGAGYPVKDYSDCFFPMGTLDFLSYSQKDAGFENEIKEHFLEVKMTALTKKIIEVLKKDKISRGKSGIILADTAVKEMSKIHQLSSGTVLLDDPEKSIIVDESKALFVKEYFKGDKIAIFYKFKAELDLLKKHFDITQDVEEFNTTDKTIALQFVAGREGIKLNKADYLVAFNIDFSATTYFQFRDRMTTIDSKVGDVYFIISDCGIEMEVYKAVSKKKKFTTQYYERTRFSSTNSEEIRSGGMVRSEADQNKQKRNTGPVGPEAQQSLFS